MKHSNVWSRSRLEPEATQFGRSQSGLRDLGFPEPELPKKVAAPQHWSEQSIDEQCEEDIILPNLKFAFCLLNKVIDTESSLSGAKIIACYTYTIHMYSRVIIFPLMRGHTILSSVTV